MFIQLLITAHNNIKEHAIGAGFIRVIETQVLIQNTVHITL